jgi:hypothetical protein
MRHWVLLSIGVKMTASAEAAPDAAAPLNAFDRGVQTRARDLKAAVLKGPAAEAAHIAART